MEEMIMCKDIQIKEERISSIEYIEFLKRTDLGSHNIRRNDSIKE